MTIKEVARLAGVSPAAVSRYLNGGPLSKDKKERVAKAIEETGYRPNLMAKTMRTGKLRQVGIIVPRIMSESVHRMMDGIAEELLEKGYLTVLGYSDSSRDRELQYLDILQSSRVAGIILMATTLTDIKKSSIESCSVPLVITGQNFRGLPCVFHDDFNAVRELTALMIRKGAKRIVYIGVLEEDKAAGLARREGCQEALRSAGMGRRVIGEGGTVTAQLPRAGTTAAAGTLDAHADNGHAPSEALRLRGGKTPAETN